MMAASMLFEEGIIGGIGAQNARAYTRSGNLIIRLHPPIRKGSALRQELGSRELYGSKRLYAYTCLSSRRSLLIYIYGRRSIGAGSRTGYTRLQRLYYARSRTTQFIVFSTRGRA